MAMAVGDRSGTLKADINITPLVDVVLVLLIIFMVITPILQMGYETNVPPKDTSVLPQTTLDQVIIRLESDGRLYINKEEVGEREFPTRLQQVLRGRESKVTFFAAAGNLSYERVMYFMDMCKNNGAQKLGIVLEELSGS
jgi:biopolymer transport protein TolR